MKLLYLQRLKAYGLCAGLFVLFSCQIEPQIKQVALQSKSVKLLEKDGFQFKDLNANAQLDPYEDWRLSPSARAADLLDQMTLEQKVGFMLISTIRMENEPGFGARDEDTPPIGEGFNEKDVESEINFFTRVPLDDTFLSAAGTTKAVRDFHGRHFILRANPKVTTLANWQNNLQALCEAQPLGIPAIIASNSRNHTTSDASVGLSLGKTAFSQWPGELGLSASRDIKLISQFADIARQEWRAVGLRKGYMYMADLSTEPRWQRIEGTFGENPQWVAQVMGTLVTGFQGSQLGDHSVALTTKHFPGGGRYRRRTRSSFQMGKKRNF
jgi:beta-glucosidase